nr:MAG TPA: hypothetical protein [Caudoviricetes sp.]
MPSFCSHNLFLLSLSIIHHIVSFVKYFATFFYYFFNFLLTF